MKHTIGFPISHKENEKRIAIVPDHVQQMNNASLLYFEEGYGLNLGIQDDDYREAGAKVVTRNEVLQKEIICDPKVGDADYLKALSQQTVFGWIHATQNREITDTLVINKLTAYAWEKMFDAGRHVFWRNNELAGEAAVMHAFQCFGKMPYETEVAVIGRGNTARGAMKVLNMLGARVMQYDRHTESLLRREIDKYDVIVNCVLWDVTRKDHIIYREDLKRMKPDAMIIDVSCDRNGGIESSIPTTIEDPIYYEDGIMHYAVDHTPAVFYKTFSRENSKVIYPYLDQLISGDLSQTMRDALIVSDGEIIDNEILLFQKR